MAASILAWTKTADLTIDAMWWLEPWRFLTSAFVHVDLMHLGFNACWMWIFGRRLEGAFGKARYVVLVIFLAVGSALAEYAFAVGGVGLSGVVYGFWGLGLVARADRRLAGMVDSRTTRLFVGWFFFCVIATATGMWKVGNWAHAAGAALGALAGLLVGRRGLARGLTATACAFAVGSLVALVRFRRIVNLQRHDAAVMAGWQGYQALQGGDAWRAWWMFTDAVAFDDGQPSYWADLGICNQRLGRTAEAREDYVRAFALDADPKMAEAIAAIDAAARPPATNALPEATP